MKKIGVLTLQGAFSEHIQVLKSLGCSTVEVKHPWQLDGLDGLILPGGESTAMLRQMNDSNMFCELKSKLSAGLPTMGTCAGMILLSKEIVGEDLKPLGAMDISVKRNAYGRQLNSFINTSPIPGVSDTNIVQIYIRAPYVVDAGSNVDILHKVENNIVAVRQDNLLAMSFHPELGNQKDLHEFFLKM